MIVNPISGKHYNINSEIGREILKIYIYKTINMVACGRILNRD